MAQTSSSKPITVKMQLIEQDWVNYQRFKWVKGKHYRFKQGLLLSFFLGGLPVFAFYNMAAAALDPVRNTWVGSYYMLIIALYFFYLWFIGYPLKYRQSPKLFKVKITYAFSESYLKISTRSPQFNNEKTIAYSDLQKGYELKSCIYLICSHEPPLIIHPEDPKEQQTISLLLMHILSEKFVDCR